MIWRLKKETGSLNSKIFFMKNDLIKETNEATTEEVVIPDECGDTMWDAVLQQEVKTCGAKTASKNAASLLNRIDAVQVSDTTKAK
jgi:hypothetical protein